MKSLLIKLSRRITTFVILLIFGAAGASSYALDFGTVWQQSGYLLPQYPHISQLFSSKCETENILAQRETFVSKDHISKIANFYKLKLFANGWQQEEYQKSNYTPLFSFKQAKEKWYAFRKPSARIILSFYRDRKKLLSYVSLTKIIFLKPSGKYFLGQEIKDLPYFSFVKRIFFMSRKEEGALIFMGTSNYPASQLSQYYKINMQRLGWECNPFFNAANKSAYEKLFLFSSQDKECLINITQSAKGLKTNICIIYRVNFLPGFAKIRAEQKIYKGG